MNQVSAEEVGLTSFFVKPPSKISPSSSGGIFFNHSHLSKNMILLFGLTLSYPNQLGRNQ